MNEIKSFRDLKVWQKAMSLLCEIYRVTAHLPDSEKYGLVAQMRRCGVGIPSNIAEGQGRGTTTDFVRFLQIARGTIHELSTQAEACILLNFHGNHQAIIEACDEIGRMINGLISSLRSNSPRPSSH